MESLLEGIRDLDVVKAENGAAALAYYWGTGRPDLIITDLQMPEMGGLELLGALEHDRAAPPRLLASGQMSPDLYCQTRFLGARGGLEKPYDFDTVREVIREIVEDGTFTRLDDYHTSKSLNGRDGILIVDDDERVRRSTGRLLARHLPGVRMALASNNEEALDVLRGSASRYGLVITDLIRDTPRAGMDFLDAIRGLGVSKLMLTGTNDPEVYRAAFRRKADGVLTKGGDPAVLCAVAKELIYTGKSPTLDTAIVNTYFDRREAEQS